jgi:AcrR family transcriptional regulator
VPSPSRQAPGNSLREAREDVLSPAGVAEIQRARIVAAMTELVRERDLAGVTVADVVERSGVSRRTFYELFENREDCFLAALDRALLRASAAVLPAYEASESWCAGIAEGLEAGLAFLDAEPQLGYLCVAAALGAGPIALERRARVSRALIAAVHRGRLESKAARRPDRLVAEGVVGAVLAILHARMRAPEPGRLITLKSPLMATIVLPYLGASAAERELKRPTPRRHRPRSRGSRGDVLRDLDMRLTYRTVRVLLAIAGPVEGGPNPNNRQVAADAGIADQGQISKLLARLRTLGLIANTAGEERGKGEPNAWTLTPKGRAVTRALQAEAV